ncbi:MAG: 30S ribosomal protein S6 [Lachnospirales bacterium]
MNNYELTLVLNPTLDTDGLKNEFDTVTGLITRFGGTVDSVDEWGKRKLAYEIEKQTEGVFYFISFNSEPSAPREIEDRIRIMENVLRFLIIRKDA